MLLNTVRTGRSQNVHRYLPVAHRTAVCPFLMLGLHSWITDITVHLFLFTKWRCTAGAEVQLHALLPLALDGGQLSPLYQATWPMGKNGGTHWIWGWVGPRASMDVLEKREASCPSRNSTQVHPVHSQSLDWLCCLGSCPDSWHTAKYHSVNQCPHYS
jgi:hypothetical protein